jgi:CYTH domain-containing protein
VGKYARIENERRFLLPPMEEEIMTLPRRAILDHYIIETGLRLRRIENEDDKVYKLTKKTNLSLGREEITTIYLSLEEYHLLSKLPAIVVSKIRFIATYNDITIGIDSYATEEDELLIAEAEFESEEQMKAFVMPLPYQMEVTGNDQFTGFTLANRFGRANRRF